MHGKQTGINKNRAANIGGTNRIGSVINTLFASFNGRTREPTKRCLNFHLLAGLN